LRIAAAAADFCGFFADCGVGGVLFCGVGGGNKI